MCKSSRCRTRTHCIIAAIIVLTHVVYAEEVLLQNDSLVVGADGTIQAGFDPGESGATWLTLPCNGNIVAVQVFWRSLVGLEPQSVEDSIEIFEAGSFPLPGTSLETIVGPVMTDTVFNEFRFLNDLMTIPLVVPVTAGQTYVISFRFLNDPNPVIGPSLVTDINGCQLGKNTINAVGIGWIDACFLGVSGDWVIRAIVDCQDVAGGPGSVPNGGDTPGEPMRVDKVGDSHVLLTWSESCSGTDNDYGVFQGFLGLWYSHFAFDCTNGGNTNALIPTDQFDRYYLVAPHDDSDEGSYGRVGNGDINELGEERPQGGGACRGNQNVTCPSLP